MNTEMNIESDSWQEIRDVLESDQFSDELSTVYHSPDTKEKNLYHTITQEQFAEFEQYLIWDLVGGLRYGQAFCERFGISNASPLYHFKGREISERWIRDNYLVKNETKIS